MTHDSYKINNYASLSGEIEGSDIKYYSVPVEQCYAWFDEEWKPLKGFDFALRVFRPYDGLLDGIEPKVMPDILYATTGEFKGKIVHTLKSCDYEIIFQGRQGREESIIRFRHFPGEDHEREEVIAVREDLTELLNKGKHLDGLTPTSAKTLV